MDRLKTHASLAFLLLMMFQASGQSSLYKVFVAQNQPAYIPGDTLFFHSLLSTIDEQLDQNRRVARVRLKNEQQETLNEINILYQNGEAFNQLLIPMNLPKNSYFLEFTFHGMYFEQHKGKVHVPMIFNGQIYQNVDEASEIKVKERNDLQLDFGEELFTRDSAQVIISQRSSDNTLSVPRSINMLYLDAFGDYADIESMFGQFEITLFDKPQSRIILKGTAFYPNSEQLLPDSVELVIYQQSTRRLYQSFVTADGQFRLELLDFFGLDRLLIGAKVKGRLVKDVRVRWDSEPFELPLQPQEQKQTGSASGYEAYASSKRLIDKSYEFFLTEDVFVTNNIVVPPIRIKPDVSFDITKYMIFESVGELVKTVINPLYYGEIDGKEVIRIKFLEETLTDQDPLFFIDGVATFDTQKFLDLPNEAMKTLTIVSEKRKLVRFGALGNYGIVIVETSLMPSNEYTTHEIVTGLNEPVFQESIDIGTFPQKQPIFEPNGLWHPLNQHEKSSSASLLMNTYDDAGTHVILITGFDSVHGFYYQSKVFEVEPR